jgi:nitrite reductase (cytochrome c-552)
MLPTPESRPRRRPWVLPLLGLAAVAGLTVLLLALLTNIFERKQEARQTYVRLVEVTEDTMDPKVWGQNWPAQYDSYLKTSLPTTTKYGGRGLAGGDTGPSEQKLERDPWLKRIFAGYAFALDYRDRRGHAYALFDQEQTRRVTERQQPGACLQCHAANLALYRFVGKGDVQKGFEQVSGMPYAEARGMKDDKGQTLIQHPVACVDCHDPKTMAVRVTRPGFIAGIKALKAHEGIADYDPNRDATRQEMRSFVCGQCHVEYYFKGPGKIVTYPWANGLKVEEIEAYYDKEGFTDWVHAETGTKVLKAQHPEFEVWSQGVHSRAGVACADCHMPYERPLGAQPAAQPQPRLPDLSRGRGEGAGGARAQHPGPPLRAHAAGGPRHHRHAGRHRRREEGGSDRGRSAGRGRPAPQGAVAARLRGRRELHGIPRPAGAGAHPGRGHRLRAPGPAGGRARHQQAVTP